MVNREPTAKALGEAIYLFDRAYNAVYDAGKALEAAASEASVRTDWGVHHKGKLLAASRAVLRRIETWRMIA